MSFNSILTQNTGSTFNSGYAKFKTPFFKIYVGLPDGSKPIEIPSQLYRLVQKVEIIENYITDVCNVDYFTVVFTEGSREPFSSLPGTNTSSIYSTDSLPGNQLTNNSGFLTDLRFTSKNGVQGITSLLPEIEIAQVNLANVTTPKSPTTITVNSTPTYLFQEGNIVTIQWGYLEFDKVRTIANPILMVQSDFPEAAQPTTTIICQSPVALLDQIASPVGVSYKQTIGGALNEIGELVVDYGDISTVDLLKSWCAKHGLIPRISPNIINDVLDKNSSKVWHSGQGFIEYVRHLAKRSNCKFRVYCDPNSNYNYVFEFINNNEMWAKSSIPSELDHLLTYKGVGSILKSFNVKADFAGLPATAHVGIDSSGTTQAATTADGSTQVVSFADSNSYINYDPSTKSSVAASIMNSEVTSNETGITTPTNKSTYNPSADSPTVLSNTALADFARCGNKMVTAEFKTLGYPLLMAGQIVNILNVGKRYSTNYHVQTVTHTIDSTGYNCTGTLTSSNIAGQIGVTPSNPKPYQAPPEQLTEPLFSALSNNGSIQSPIDLVTQSRNNRFVS